MKIKDGKFIIPASLANYFKKKKPNPYDHVKSRLFGYEKNHALIKKQQHKKNSIGNRFPKRVRGSKSLSNLKNRNDHFS